MFVVSSSTVLFLLLRQILLTEFKIMEISLSLMLRKLLVSLIQEERIRDWALSLTLF